MARTCWRTPPADLDLQFTLGGCTARRSAWANQLLDDDQLCRPHLRAAPVHPTGTRSSNSPSGLYAVVSDLGLTGAVVVPACAPACLAAWPSVLTEGRLAGVLLYPVFFISFMERCAAILPRHRAPPSPGPAASCWRCCCKRSATLLQLPRPASASTPEGRQPWAACSARCRSIVVLNRQRERFVAHAIRSACAQTLEREQPGAVRVIVVGDGSRDGSHRDRRRAQAALHRARQAGPAAINAGFAAAAASCYFPGGGGLALSAGGPRRCWPPGRRAW